MQFAPTATALVHPLLTRKTLEIEPTEHVAYLWLPVEAAIEKVASWTNREALQRLKDSRRA